MSVADSKAVSGATATSPLLPATAINITAAPYSADSTGAADATAAVVAAINAGSATGTPIIVPAGTYKIVPATVTTDAAGATTVALVMKSNMHIVAERGATFKLADNQSTDALPKSLYMFFTNVALTNVSIRGLAMDMNGANNKISPNRGSGTYDTGKNMAHIGCSTDTGRIDDMVVEYCQFLNSSGCNCLVAGHSATAGITLGKRWTIAHNLFKNNGTDTSDQSSVYAWADFVDCHDNQFIEDSPYGTVGHTGAQTAYEAHGAHHSFHDNTVKNYLRGAYIANNYTSAVYAVDIHDNLFEVTYEAVAVYRTGASAGAVRDARIHDNIVILVEQAFSGSAASQIVFDVTPTLTVSDIKIEHNHVSKPGANTIPAILCLVQPNTAAVSFSNIRVNHNTAINLTSGVQFRTNGTNGGLGYSEAVGNEFVNFLDVAASSSIGIYVDATNTIKTLVLDRNRFIDERGGSSTFGRGIFLNAGTITDLSFGPQAYKGMTIARYTESGGVVIANRNGTTHVAGDYVLSAGWGNTATVSTVSARDAGGRVSVTSAGAGTAADPTLSLVFKDLYSWAVAPVVTASRGDVAAPSAGVWRLTAISDTTATWCFVGTPVAGNIYILDFAVAAK